MLHADPHPGNFRILPDGRMGVLDFGAVNRLPGGYPKVFGTLLRIFNQGDMETVIPGLRGEGFILPHITVDPDELRAFLAPYVEPTRVEEFTFSREWLQRQAASVADIRSNERGAQAQPAAVVRADPPGARGRASACCASSAPRPGSATR